MGRMLTPLISHLGDWLFSFWSLKLIDYFAGYLLDRLVILSVQNLPGLLGPKPLGCLVDSVAPVLCCQLIKKGFICLVTWLSLSLLDSSLILCSLVDCWID
jgi:hypothetical protein